MKNSTWTGNEWLAAMASCHRHTNTTGTTIREPATSTTKQTPLSKCSGLRRIPTFNNLKHVPFSMQFLFATFVCSAKTCVLRAHFRLRRLLVPTQNCHRNFTQPRGNFTTNFSASLNPTSCSKIDTNFQSCQSQSCSRSCFCGSHGHCSCTSPFRTQQPLLYTTTFANKTNQLPIELRMCNV